MSNLKEIELKFYLGDDNNALSLKIAEKGWLQIEEDHQEDIYYTSKYKDFIETEECLRVRVTSQKEELTWKPPTSEAMRLEGQYWKQEINIDVTGEVDKIRSMLTMLDFIEYIRVKKYRQLFKIDDTSSIALDYIETLGWFAEIETFSSSEGTGIKKNMELAKQIGINRKPQINIPYRDMVKAGKVYTNL